MKILRKLVSEKHRFLAILIVLCTLLPLGYREEYQGTASSYDNAKEFYDSIDRTKKADAYGGDFYMATMAKLASSSSSLKYQTLGFDITLFANGYSVSFSVALGGSMEHLAHATVPAGGYEYNLFKISTKTLHDLAFSTNPSAAQQIFANLEIYLIANAIMTTKQRGTLNGSIAENGRGGLSESGTVYHLGNSSHLSTMKSRFSGHKFETYINIDGTFDNHNLSIIYVLGDGATVGNGYSSQTYTAGSMSLANTLHVAGQETYMETYTEKNRVFQSFRLLDPATINLRKTGYHLNFGEEWVNSSQYAFTPTQTYMPKTLAPNVAHQNTGVILYANWKANTYTVTYDANGGSGAVMPTSMTYDVTTALRNNTFTRTGYYLSEGKEWIDANGNTYASNESVSNLTTEDGVTLTLYANWEPIVVSVTMDKKGGTGGSDTVYEKYRTGFYSDETTSNKITQIQIPSKSGYTFEGYYANYYPSGLLIVGSDGTINVPSTYFNKNSILYADYKPKTYTVTFDKQGGTGGTDFVTAVYDEVLSFAEAPVKKGASFKGYYTEPNGQGTMYYNEFMASDVIYKTDSNMTLYAYWVDDTIPEAYLTANNNNWSNRTITLNVSATDYGSGLSSVILYQDGTKVAEYTGLNGVMNKTFTFNNNKEGVIIYLLVATDMSGNTTEVQRPVYYDIKPPVGTINYRNVSGNVVSFRVNVTDINVQ